MNVNKNRLNKLIQKIIKDCCDCPIYNPNEMCEYLKNKDVRCEDLLYTWLQKFDVSEALEAGAHIVNDIVIFPPEEIPFAPFYGTPCEAATPKGKHGPYCNGKDCDYVDCCPYDW